MSPLHLALNGGYDHPFAVNPFPPHTALAYAFELGQQDAQKDDYS